MTADICIKNNPSKTFCPSSFRICTSWILSASSLHIYLGIEIFYMCSLFPAFLIVKPWNFDVIGKSHQTQCFWQNSLRNQNFGSIKIQELKGGLKGVIRGYRLELGRGVRGVQHNPNYPHCREDGWRQEQDMLQRRKQPLLLILLLTCENVNSFSDINCKMTRDIFPIQFWKFSSFLLFHHFLTSFLTFLEDFIGS